MEPFDGPLVGSVSVGEAEEEGYKGEGSRVTGPKGYSERKVTEVTGGGCAWGGGGDGVRGDRRHGWWFRVRDKKVQRKDLSLTPPSGRRLGRGQSRDLVERKEFVHGNNTNKESGTGVLVWEE